MSGPSVVVRFLGDLKGLTGSIDDTGKKSDTMTSRASAGFHSMLGVLNKSGVLGPFGEALDGVDQAFEAVAKHGKTTGETMAGVGAGMAATGAILSAFGSKEAASHQQLQAAVAATGKSYDDYSDKIEATIKKQENFGHTSAETQDALRILTQATHDPAKAIEYLGTASDVAAAKHESLGSAATAVGKVYNGNTRLLKEFGITAGTTAVAAQKALETATKGATSADDASAKAKQNLADLHERLSAKSKITVSDQQALRKATDAVASTTLASLGAHQKLSDAQANAAKSANNQKDTMQKLADVTKGQASAATDTFAGKLDAMKTKLEDQVSMIGQKYGPALQGVGLAVTALGTVWSVVGPMIEAGELSALGPILLIIAGIAALGVAIYVIYKNWDTIWSAMKASVEFVWNWIKANWPLLLGILFGPIGLAVALIVTNFDTVKKVVADAVNFIVGLWNGLLSFFRSVIASIGSVASGIWRGITSAVSGEVAAIKGIWNDFVGWFGGIASAIGRAGSDMWNGLLTAFKSVINAIAHAWNSTVGALHVDIPGWVPGIGGHGFDAPNIPTLAQGGIVTQTGLILAHAGEAISPIPHGAMGPAVTIDTVNLGSDLDVDSFTRRLAWNLQTAGV